VTLRSFTRVDGCRTHGLVVQQRGCECSVIMTLQQACIGSSAKLAACDSGTHIMRRPLWMHDTLLGAP